MLSQILYKNSWIGLVNVVHLCTPAQSSARWRVVGWWVVTGAAQYLSKCLKLASN